MKHRKVGRGVAATSCVLALALVAAACGGDEESPDSQGDNNANNANNAECAAYESYGDLEGTEIEVYSPITAPEDVPYINAFAPFEECTGATVNYQGSNDMEAQLPVRIRSGSPPDIAFLPQPGLLQTLVRDTGAVKPAPEAVEANVDEYWGEDWKGYGTVDGTFYAAPLGANVKSFVWYSPSQFSEAGYKIPQTWDEMVALSDQIVADGGKPWCAGIGSGDSTGWPATDWMEDIMLRMYGPEVYDQWTNHEIPFNDPKVADVLAEAGSFLKNDEYVNGGLGGVPSIAGTSFEDAGLPVLDGTCYLHRQASFYQANWPEGTEVAENGDVFAFYLPPMSEEFGNPVLGGGEFTVAFSDEPEVQAFQAFLSSAEFANLRAGEGNWISANSGLDVGNVDTEINKLSVEILQDPNAVFRFDASDLMPGEVGAVSFWKEMTAWIANDKGDQAVLDAIEQSWPE